MLKQSKIFKYIDGFGSRQSFRPDLHLWLVSWRGSSLLTLVASTPWTILHAAVLPKKTEMTFSIALFLLLLCFFFLGVITCSLQFCFFFFLLRDVLLNIKESTWYFLSSPFQPSFLIHCIIFVLPDDFGSINYMDHITCSCATKENRKDTWPSFFFCFCTS